MKPLRPILLIGLLCSFGVADAAPASLVTTKSGVTAGVTVSGDVTKPGTWTVAQIQKLAPPQTVKTTLKGVPYMVKGVPLKALVEAAALRVDSKAKHPEAHYIVLATGQDGYSAALAWPELLAGVGDKNALIVWEANGQPLSGKDGPLRLVVPGESKPMRWVYRLASVQVYDGTRYHK